MGPLRPATDENEGGAVMTSHLALTIGMLALIVGAVVIAILIAPNDLPPNRKKVAGGSRGQST